MKLQGIYIEPSQPDNLVGDQDFYHYIAIFNRVGYAWSVSGVVILHYTKKQYH